jgi:dTDP-4-dehydrorhamnose reductase
MSAVLQPGVYPATKNQEVERIVVLGAGGQVGRALTTELGSSAVPLTRADLDLNDVAGAVQKLEEVEPSALINAAAYTNVDKAESETDVAFRINGDAAGFLARWCRQKQVPFLHFSTDYVFSGAGDRPWTEDDAVSPLNAYGRSKLDGERKIAASGGQWLVLRTSWVYDDSGRNFLTTMLRLGAERESLAVVNDQWGAPTYAAHLAKAALAVLSAATAQDYFPSGIYHVCNAGQTTWYEFASAIFDRARSEGRSLKLRTLIPVSSAEYPTVAHRPTNSRLNMDRLRMNMGICMESWQAGLMECMAAVSHGA